MKKYFAWFQGSGIRLAFIIATTTTALLLTLNIVISYREENTFVTAVQTIPFSSFQLRTQINPNDYLPGQPFLPQNLKTPRQTFVNTLHEDLNWITALGIFVSLILGIMLGEKFITKPLRKLQDAISSLKGRDFSTKVDPTGLPEFDYVVDEFNDLVHELARAEKLRQDLISDTSHELKTPLTALRAQLEGMRDGLIPLEKKRIELLLTHVDRLHNLTERLQEYTRLRNRTAHIEVREIPLRDFVEGVVKELEKELTDKKITVTVEIEENALLLADKHLLEELFHNILANTLHYAEASRITIALKGHTLYIADNGKGVPPEALVNLFERFFRVEPSRSRNTGGLGLGLAIVKEIAEAHSWKISVENLKPHGLVFAIVIS